VWNVDCSRFQRGIQEYAENNDPELSVAHGEAQELAREVAQALDNRDFARYRRGRIISASRRG
jgi:hypothetical protein